MDTKTRADLIREIFAEIGTGGTTTRQVAEVLVEKLNEEQTRRYMIQGIQAYVREILGRKDKHGLPVAGQCYSRLSPSGELLWLPRAQWARADYEYNIHHLKGERAGLDASIEGLRQECVRRFGACDA